MVEIKGFDWLNLQAVARLKHDLGVVLKEYEAISRDIPSDIILKIREGGVRNLELNNKY